MEVETIQATFLRLYLRDFMERVKFRGERFIVQTFGRPMMVLISYEDYLLVKHRLPRTPRMMDTIPFSQSQESPVEQTADAL